MHKRKIKRKRAGESKVPIRPQVPHAQTVGGRKGRGTHHGQRAEVKGGSGRGEE